MVMLFCMLSISNCHRVRSIPTDMKADSWMSSGVVTLVTNFKTNKTSSSRMGGSKHKSHPFNLRCNLFGDVYQTFKFRRNCSARTDNRSSRRLFRSFTLRRIRETPTRKQGFAAPSQYGAEMFAS
jgi:hypothetical protein